MFINCNIKHHRRIVNLPKRRRIIFIRLDQHVTAVVGNALQFTREINGLFPGGDAFGDLVADAADSAQGGLGGAEDLGRVAEMFQQRPHPHRPDALNHV